MSEITNKTKVKSPKRDIKWFEGGWLFFTFKLLIAVCVYIFIIEPLFFEYFIKNADLDFLNGRQFTFLFIILFVLSVITGCVHGEVKKSVFTFSGFFITFLLVYLIYFLSGVRYDLYPTEYKIKYFHVLLLIPLFSWLSYLYVNYFPNILNTLLTGLTKKELTSIPETDRKSIQFEPDLSLRDSEETQEGYGSSDFLGYHSLANVVLEAIESLSPKKAFSIGINGTWGSGKSSLIDILKYDLIPKYNEQRGIKKEIRIISFSPWLYPDQEFVPNFFSQWKDEIDDIGLKMIFDDYASLLHDVRFGEMIVKVQQLFSQSKSLENVKKKIEEYLLKQNNNKYLVIIDDLDRLESKEILAIARLSRVLADFPNTFYLLAYDRKYIDNILQKENNPDDKGHTYFDKIVQMEYKIPQVTEPKLGNYMRTLVLKNIDFITQSEPGLTKERIETILGDIQTLRVYQYYLPTVRDVKRFLNGFLLRYNSLRKGGHMVAFKEVFLLEMLFYKHKGEYESFYQMRNDIRDAQLSEAMDSIGRFANINTGARINIRIILLEIFKDLTNSARKSLLDAYYSYFDNKELSQSDITSFINENASKANLARTYFSEGQSYGLIQGFIERTLNTAESRKISFADLEQQWRRVFDIFNHTFAQLKITVPDEESLSSYYSQQKAALEKVQKNPTFSNDSQAITRCIRLLETSNTYYETFDPSKDNVIQYIKSVESDDPVVFKIMDDSTFNRVLDLNKHFYEIILVNAAPGIAHWRFGFKLSKDNNFPIGRGFRYNQGYPLFHIGKHFENPPGPGPKPDNDNIRVTVYNQQNLCIDGNTSLDNIVFLPAENEIIKIYLQYYEDDIFIELWNGQSKIAMIQNLLFKGYSKCKLYAWADNQKINNGEKYQFVVEIKEITIRPRSPEV